MTGVAPAPPEAPRAERLLAVIRLTALPVLLVGERLVPYPGERSAWFLPILALAAAYAGLTAWRAWRTPHGDGIPPWQLTLDVLFLSALAYSSGGPFSEARFGFFVVPVAAALLARPRVTAGASVVAVGAYVAVSLLHPGGEQTRAGAVEIAHVAYLAWTGVAATLVSFALARRATQVAGLASSRGRLVAQMLESEDHERRQLAEALHDDAIQNLLAARQELSPGREAGADFARVRLGLDRTLAQLRGAVFDLHPHVLEHAGLGAALEAVADDCARWGGFQPQLEVEPGLQTSHEQLLFSVGRELMRNVARHAHASRLRARIARAGDETVLVVADDGVGFDPELIRSAPLTGHIGLAAMGERVEAVGGRLRVDSRRGSGTRIEVRVPEAPDLLLPPARAGLPVGRLA